ncbi:MAG: hypothetical protein HQ509_11210 [Candidatus Marinimicrobia bacterium]|nr:hypothetical protein [Candidatus Neomarinimicrobiota bacterium]
MAKKTVGFAGKVKGKDHVEIKLVKYVKSVRSEKTGHWRFNESMIRLVGGESLDATLKRLGEESMALDIEMPTFDEPVAESGVEEVAPPDEAEPEKVAEEKAEAAE